MNIYISKIKSISHKNKYTNWYINIIQHALKRKSNKNFYYEKHHIIPKSFKMGGEKDKLNLVHLTAREHFIVHMLLVKMTVNTQLKIKMSCALTKMMDKKYNNSRTYETARKIFSKNNPMFFDEIKEQYKKTNIEKYGYENPSQSDIVKNKIKQTNIEKYGCKCYTQSEQYKEQYKKTCLDLYGYENAFQNEDIKQKSKETCLEKYGTEYACQSEEIKEKIKKTNTEKYGVDHPNKTPEARKMLSERAKQMRANEPILTCPHCGLSGKGPNMKRYHFDNCKKKPKD